MQKLSSLLLSEKYTISNLANRTVIYNLNYNCWKNNYCFNLSGIRPYSNQFFSNPNLKTMIKELPATGSVPKVIKVEEVHRENWLTFKKLTWVDKENKTRIWETAERTTRKETGCDAIAIFAIIKGKSTPPSTVIVCQFRPPVANFTVELPAGLIDKGETCEQAAIRELLEETGYTGKPIYTSPLIVSDPGMSNANMKIVYIQVDADTPENINPQIHPDDGEFIDRYIIQISELPQKLKEFTAKRILC